MSTVSPKPLFEAAQSSNYKRVKKLLAEGADPNAMHEGMTPLFAACASGMPDVEVINALLSAGADPDLGGDKSPLMQAVAVESAEGVAALLRAGANVNIRDNNGETPLMPAARYSDAIVKLLLDAGADPDAQDQAGKTPLFHAIERFNKKTIELLRAVTTTTESSERPWRSENSQQTDDEKFQMAVQYGDLSFVEQMLSLGIYVNKPGIADKTALHIACEKGLPDVVKLLLAHGADLEARNSSGFTPLSSAAFGGNSEVVRLLLNAGAEVNSVDNTGSNALFRCVPDDNVELVRLLVEAGIDVNLKNESFRFTPLHIAVENAWWSGHDKTPEIVELLVKAGADVNAVRTKKDKFTPLHRGIRHLPTLKKLLELGADPNFPDGDGTSPLMYAAQLSVDHVQVLLAAGADPEQQDKEGKSAIVYATEAGKADVANFLRSYTPASESAERPWRSKKAKLKPEVRLAEAAKGGDLAYVRQLLQDKVKPIPPALQGAAEGNSVEALKLLLDHKAELNAKDSEKRTALIAATTTGSTEAALYLLSIKADVKALDQEGNSALHYAAQNGNLELITALIGAGADVNQPCKYFKNTPLHSALLYARPEQMGPTAKALIAAGADVNRKNSEGGSPLHIAANQPSVEAVKVLIEAGASLTELDDNEHTPAESARKWGSPEVAAYLEAQG